MWNIWLKPTQDTCCVYISLLSSPIQIQTSSIKGFLHLQISLNTKHYYMVSESLPDVLNPGFALSSSSSPSCCLERDRLVFFHPKLHGIHVDYPVQWYIYIIYIYIDSIPFILFHFMCAENLEFWITIGTVSRYQDFPWRQLQLFISPPQELSIAASQGLPSLITNIPTIFIQTLAYNIQGCCWRYLSCWRLLPKCTYISLIFPLLKSFPKSMQPSGCRVCKKPVPWPEISNQNIEVPHTWEQGPCWEETYWIYLTQSTRLQSVCIQHSCKNMYVTICQYHSINKHMKNSGSLYLKAQLVKLEI